MGVWLKLLGFLGDVIWFCRCMGSFVVVIGMKDWRVEYFIGFVGFRKSVLVGESFLKMI